MVCYSNYIWQTIPTHTNVLYLHFHCQHLIQFCFFYSFFAIEFIVTSFIICFIFSFRIEQPMEEEAQSCYATCRKCHSKCIDRECIVIINPTIPTSAALKVPQSTRRIKNETKQKISWYGAKYFINK